jgi:hypothetical protein
MANRQEIGVGGETGAADCGDVASIDQVAPIVMIVPDVPGVRP